MKNKIRKEKDFLGELEIPIDAYWGTTTQRAIKNFQISEKKFPTSFILALITIKKACLMANLELGIIEKEESHAIFQAIEEILVERKFLDQFPIDIFQTGSGTQINMNINEVLANRANELLGSPLGKKFPVHPNDHVNKSQSSNDIIPTAMHLSALTQLHTNLFPALNNLGDSLMHKIDEFKGIIKVGRTHLQDAVPIPLATEFMVYQRQIDVNRDRLEKVCKELSIIPIGGTVLGTGINADKRFGDLVVSYLKDITGFDLSLNPVKAEGIASHNTIVNVSGSLRLLALSLLKMANDIRWMGSGPRAGLGELKLPPNEPGSSIMPGKVNPTQSEALIQVCLQVIGNDAVISYAEGYSSILDLNVAKPVMIVNLLESIEILTNGMNSFVEHCLTGLQADTKQIDAHLEKILMVVTNLVPLIGYDQASEIANIANQTGKTIKEVILEKGIEIKGNLNDLLDPKKMV
ncbi:MAG: class II fumarate hydratase [Candidatus Helarchaeota archaeon]|nr:class II fumarate hydratase [Candidatus Helarchaeota archaeon]